MRFSIRNKKSSISDFSYCHLKNKGIQWKFSRKTHLCLMVILANKAFKPISVINKKIRNSILLKKHKTLYPDVFTLTNRNLFFKRNNYASHFSPIIHSHFSRHKFHNNLCRECKIPLAKQLSFPLFRKICLLR